MKEQYTVGEFSEMFGLNVQTLRYYDSIELFKPSRRDERTGRRHYAFDQVYGLASIRFLRRLGYSLQEVQEYLNRRQAGETLDILKKRSEELHRQLQELMDLDAAIQRKITYTRAALQTMEKVGGPEAIVIKKYGPRHYIPIGDEKFLYFDDSFYLYPTIAFYEGKIKTFGAYLYSQKDEAGELPGALPTQTIEAGNYLCGYHQGPYEEVNQSNARLREAHPELVLSEETIDFNIIDQFVERDSQKYLTSMQIRILGKK